MLWFQKKEKPHAKCRKKILKIDFLDEKIVSNYSLSANERTPREPKIRTILQMNKNVCHLRCCLCWKMKIAICQLYTIEPHLLCGLSIRP